MLTYIYLVYITRCHCKAQNATLHNDNFDNNKRLNLLVTAKAVEHHLLVVMMSRTVFILVTVQCIERGTYHLS